MRAMRKHNLNNDDKDDTDRQRKDRNKRKRRMIITITKYNDNIYLKYKSYLPCFANSSENIFYNLIFSNHDIVT